MSKSSFPKLSQLWRAGRLAGSTFSAAALAGFAHLAWPSRTAVIAVAVAAAEVAYRAVFPSGVLSGKVAAVLSAYRQVVAAARDAQTVVAAVESPPPAVDAKPAEAAAAPAEPVAPAAVVVEHPAAPAEGAPTMPSGGVPAV